MKKKLLALLIAASSMLMPNLASAVAVDFCYLEPNAICQHDSSQQSYDY